MIVAPEALAKPLQVSTKSAAGNSSFGEQQVKFTPSFEQITISELATLFLASPKNTSFKPFNLPKFSYTVIKSANICVGWNSLVKPFHTGTVA